MATMWARVTGSAFGKRKPRPSSPPCDDDATDGGGGGGGATSRTAMKAEAPASIKARSHLSSTRLDRLLEAEALSLSDLAKTAWNGVPVRRRRTTWMLLLGYTPVTKSKRDAGDQVTLRQILVDVPRTTPSVPLFSIDRIQNLMIRVLYVWAVRHPASGYVQGMNDLLSILLIVFVAAATQRPEDTYEELDEAAIQLTTVRADALTDEELDEVAADTYWCLTKILDTVHDHYTHQQLGLQHAAAQVDGLLRRVDAELHRHLTQERVALLQITFRWINCLLVRELPIRAVVRLWDTCIAEDKGFEKFFPYVCAAFLCHFSDTIRALDHENLHLFLQSLPTRDWNDDDVETLLSEAYILSQLFRDAPHHLIIDHSAPPAGGQPPPPKDGDDDDPFASL